MSVELLAIRFDHDPASARADALTIRRNATSGVPSPEWQRGLSVLAQDSPAAYSINDTRRSGLTLQARFRCTDPRIGSAEIRAVAPPTPAPPPGLVEALLGPWSAYPQLVQIYRDALRSLGTSGRASAVLGEVAPRRIDFGADGLSGFEVFELRNAGLWSAGVGVHDIRWQWQARLASATPWSPIAETTHRVYVLLNTPTAPWQARASQALASQLPWTDVLDHACTWAAGARDADTAAAAITRAVYAHGSLLLRYDCVDVDGFGIDFLGSPHYTWLDPFDVFECTLFLERLRGGFGAGPYVNCTDCAAIVSTFANALGCNLWQSRMGYSFALNPLLAIGASAWERACGNFGSFFMHEVAWKGDCLADDAVFDACVALDASGHPAWPPHLPFVPADLRFGLTEQGLYRDLLAAPVASGRPLCNPQPLSRRRRWVR